MKALRHAILALASLGFAHAEGPQLGDDGRLTEGPVVVIRLTAAQKAFLSRDHGSAVAGAMKLTPGQSARIRAQAKVETTLVEVWDTRNGRGDCSCHSVNIALRFAEDFAEVLVPYLKADREALAKWRSVDAID